MWSRDLNFIANTTLNRAKSASKSFYKLLNTRRAATHNFLVKAVLHLVVAEVKIS